MSLILQFLSSLYFCIYFVRERIHREENIFSSCPLFQSISWCSSSSGGLNPLVALREPLTQLPCSHHSLPSVLFVDLCHREDEDENKRLKSDYIFFFQFTKMCFSFLCLLIFLSSSKKRKRTLHLQTKNFHVNMFIVDCHNSLRKHKNPSLAIYENLHCVVNSLFTARHCPRTG